MEQNMYFQEAKPAKKLIGPTTNLKVISNLHEIWWSNIAKYNYLPLQMGSYKWKQSEAAAK